MHELLYEIIIDLFDVFGFHKECAPYKEFIGSVCILPHPILPSDRDFLCGVQDCLKLFVSLGTVKLSWHKKRLRITPLAFVFSSRGPAIIRQG